jgi:hydrogenase nickel incorporation protein HypA/HybF
LACATRSISSANRSKNDHFITGTQLVTQTHYAVRDHRAQRNNARPSVHEISVARSLADFVCEQIAGSALAGGTSRVARVRVRVGAMAGIVPQALKSAFCAAVVGTALQGSELEIEAVDLIVWCPRCHQQQMLSGIARLRCPVCDSPTPRIVHGKELEIASIEMEEVDPSDRVDHLT